MKTMKRYEVEYLPRKKGAGCAMFFRVDAADKAQAKAEAAHLAAGMVNGYRVARVQEVRQ